MKQVKSMRADGNMPIIVIPVSSKLIENAIRSDSHKCMIADAIKARVPKAQYISVDVQSIRFTNPETKTRYKYFTPLAGQQGLVNFDQGKKIKPFALTLKDGTQESIAHATAKRRKRRNSSRSHQAIKGPYKSRAKKERKFGLRNLE